MAFFIRCSDTANSLKNITCIGLRGLSVILEGNLWVLNLCHTYRFTVAMRYQFSVKPLSILNSPLWQVWQCNTFKLLHLLLQNDFCVP
jgi:hypothetical protein